MRAYDWYQTLIKPSWSPPAWILSPVWTILYVIIFVSFGYVFYKVLKRELPKLTALPFVLNILFNLAFTPIQFGLKNNFSAAVDILLVLITLIWFFKISWVQIRWVAYVNIPYLSWVVFATFLQLTITYLNL